MDEAENCNRMVLIYHGTIIAQGTPQEMKTSGMKNQVLEIQIADAQNWLEGVKKIEGVKEAALFGANIHAVVYDSTKAMPLLNAYFARENVKDFSVNKILPSLEDVFVSSIEEYDRTELKKD
jgi:ABC-2 type transport system ATP-binding protein